MELIIDGNHTKLCKLHKLAKYFLGRHVITVSGDLK